MHLLGVCHHLPHSGFAPGLQEEQLSSSPRSAISQGTQHLPPLHLGSVYVEAAAAFKPARHPAADSQGNKSWVLSQPGRASAVVPVATSVSLTKVRVPEAALFSHRPPKPAAEAQQGGGLDDRDKGDEATSLSAINAAADEAADISSALAQHLQEQRHIVAQVRICCSPTKLRAASQSHLPPSPRKQLACSLSLIDNWRNLARCGYILRS